MGLSALGSLCLVLLRGTLVAPPDASFSVSGRITDREGRGVRGARVMAYRQIGSAHDSLIERLMLMPQITEIAQKPPAQTASGNDGSYRIEGLERRYYIVKAIARGFAPAERPEVLPNWHSVNFQLAPGGRFCGEVVDSAGGAVAGAKVMAYNHVDSSDLFAIIESRSRPPFETVETGSGGEFCFETLGAGSYNFVAAKKGYQEARLLKIKVREEDNPRQHFMLTRGLTIAGTVVSASNEPVAGARVRATRVGETGQREQYFIKFDDGSIFADEQGHFTFDTLEAGKYTLLAYHRDHASEQRRDVEAGTEDLTITLSSGGAIQGTITEAGTRTPIAGARVSVNDLQDLRKEGITDEKGSYFIGGLNATGNGRRYLNVQAQGYARISNFRFHVEEGKVLEKQDLELVRTASVSGRVVNARRQGMSGARVIARRKGANSQVAFMVGSAVTGDDGRYVIGDIEAGEETFLSTAPPIAYLEPEYSAHFALQPGESKEAAEIVLHRGGTVKGVVLGPDGRGIGGVQVLGRRKGETTPDVALSATTEPGGRFLIQGLPGGTVLDLIARSSHHLEEVMPDVRVGQEVQIVLRRGGRIGGRVVDPRGRPVHGARVVAGDVSESGFQELEAETGQDGRFLVENIRGTDGIAVEVHHPDFGRWSNDSVKVNTEDLEVALGTLKEVEGTVAAPREKRIRKPVPEEGGVISGTVLDTASGRPLPGARVRLLGGMANFYLPFRRLPPGDRSVAVTDGRGTFEFRGLMPGPISLKVAAGGHAAERKDRLDPSKPAKARGLRIELELDQVGRP